MASWPGRFWRRRQPPAAERPGLGPGQRIYAIGDIHGRLDLLRKLAGLIAADLDKSPPGSSLAVFLGDYVDRGPSSRGVVDFLADACPVCQRQVFLRGNHEDILLDVLSSPSALADWLRLGGIETLASYGVPVKRPLGSEGFAALQQRFREKLPETHRRFLESTRLHFEAGGYLFVHAGVRPGIPLSRQERQDMLWIRDEFLSSAHPSDRVVVHGHTPCAAPEMLPHRINVDTGAFATGRLTCVALENSHRRILTT